MIEAALLVDLAIGVSLAEGLALVLLHRRRGRGIAPADLLPNLAAGLGLMAALRAALGGSAPVWVGLWLAAAGLAHLLDLRRRWGRRRG